MRNTAEIRVRRFTIDDNHNVFYYETTIKLTPRINLSLCDFMLQHKGCIIKHLHHHYDAIIFQKIL